MEGNARSEDPILRREQFAISLRKKKRVAIIGSKRKKTMEAISRQRNAAVASPEIFAMEAMRGKAGMSNAIDNLQNLLSEPNS